MLLPPLIIGLVIADRQRSAGSRDQSLVASFGEEQHERHVCSDARQPRCVSRPLGCSGDRKDAMLSVTAGSVS